jgi:hypothetical protein
MMEVRLSGGGWVGSKFGSTKRPSQMGKTNRPKRVVAAIPVQINAATWPPTQSDTRRTAPVVAG